mmetsp:Transcript_39720/g.118199  ORF Transcript_39720/g.118199 Transcript_39720/m.118199 type:complete len:365 (+) Transcript_39720:289-1383(+)
MALSTVFSVSDDPFLGSLPMDGLEDDAGLFDVLNLLDVDDTVHGACLDSGFLDSAPSVPLVAPYHPQAAAAAAAQVQWCPAASAEPVSPALKAVAPAVPGPLALPTTSNSSGGSTASQGPSSAPVELAVQRSAGPPTTARLAKSRGPVRLVTTALTGECGKPQRPGPSTRGHVGTARTNKLAAAAPRAAKPVWSDDSDSESDVSQDTDEALDGVTSNRSSSGGLTSVSGKANKRKVSRACRFRSSASGYPRRHDVGKAVGGKACQRVGLFPDDAPNCPGPSRASNPAPGPLILASFFGLTANRRAGGVGAAVKFWHFLWALTWLPPLSDSALPHRLSSRHQKLTGVLSPTHPSAAVSAAWRRTA